MENKNPFNVNMPIEIVERWIKDEGIDDGAIFEHQEVIIDTLFYNKDTGYVEFSGDLISRMNS